MAEKALDRVMEKTAGTAAGMLFSHYFLPYATLPNRIVMAPMTRARSAQPGDVPTALMAEYYAQRASAGLIITEATQVSPQGKGYSFTPGIHSAAQVEGWKLVTDAVHAAGDRIAREQPLAVPGGATLFGGGRQGYADYPPVSG